MNNVSNKLYFFIYFFINYILDFLFFYYHMFYKTNPLIILSLTVMKAFFFLLTSFVLTCSVSLCFSSISSSRSLHKQKIIFHCRVRGKKNLE